MSLMPNHYSRIRPWSICRGQTQHLPHSQNVHKRLSYLQPHQGTLPLFLIFRLSLNCGPHSMCIFLTSFVRHWVHGGCILQKETSRTKSTGGDGEKAGRTMTWVSHPQMNKMKLLSEKVYTCETTSPYFTKRLHCGTISQATELSLGKDAKMAQS